MRLESAIRGFQVPGASLAVWHQGQMHVEAAGIACLATGRPVSPDTRFQIGSITKLLTAALVHRMLPLETPLWDLLPEWRGTDKAGLTAALLLSHRSGLDGDAFEPLGEGEEAASRLLALTAADPLLHPPGMFMSYCNLGFVALGLALARARNSSWAELVATELCTPAGTPGLSPDCSSDDAVGHLGGRKAPVGMLAASNAAAGTTLRGSARDGVALLAAMAGWTGRSPLFPGFEEASALLAPVPPGHEVTGFGLGPARFGWSRPCFGHDGMTIGQQGFARLWPETRTIALLLANGGDMRGLARTILSAIAAEFADCAPAAPLEAAAGSQPPVGIWARRNASLEIQSAGASATLARRQHEDWAQKAYGTEGPWPLVPAGPGHWLWAVPCQSLPTPVAQLDDSSGRAIHLGMRRYNLRDPDC